MASPACVAVIVQLPDVTTVMFKPLTVHTPVVDELSETVRPEDAVAFEANVPAFGALVPGFANVIVCVFATGTIFRV